MYIYIYIYLYIYIYIYIDIYIFIYLRHSIEVLPHTYVALKWNNLVIYITVYHGMVLHAFQSIKFACIVLQDTLYNMIYTFKETVRYTCVHCKISLVMMVICAYVLVTCVGTRTHFVEVEISGFNLLNQFSGQTYCSHSSPETKLMR
jgi:hypothetical protein